MVSAWYWRPNFNASANTTSTDLAGAPRFDGTLDLGALEGNVDATFALLHPTLDPNADDNLNGISNYGDYAAGGDPNMPAAIVENGTRPDQRVITGTIADLPARKEAANLGQPSLIVIGSVVTLQGELAWFEAAEGDRAAL